MGLTQSWLSTAVRRFERDNSHVCPLHLLTWTPGGQNQHEFDLPDWKLWFEQQVHRAGLEMVIGGIDVSWNEDCRKRGDQHREGWVVQLHALVPEKGIKAAKEQLKAIAPADDEVRRPVWSTPYDGSRKARVYLLKPNFQRRQTRERIHPITGRLVRDTRDDDLTVAQKKELCLALDHAGMFSRIILVGVSTRFSRRTGVRISLSS